MTHSSNVPNRLINEHSPYLLQHAYNPVDWFPWGKEAFEKARLEDKPVFLSIGYSTCHWCHVMERESFEDREVAELLNKDYISIKVDREERPDIDSVYMNICQLVTGQGGWPLTVIMTPEQKPFFVGTYYPKKSYYNMTGLVDILNYISESWISNRKKLVESGEEIIKYLRQQDNFEGGEINDFDKSSFKRTFKDTFELLKQQFDNKFGGFGSSPKFPTPHNLMFLLRYHYYEKNEEALNMVEKTLQNMYLGGIFDHIGYGFSRYSTDDKWLVPHFEKMLYDNALLSIVYLETYQVTGKQIYRDIADKIFTYIEREMLDSDGGAFSAQDADSEGEEGVYYTFTPDEVTELLGKSDATFVNEYFSITSSGNFEGKSIPNRIGKAPNDDERINALLPKLYEYRKNRTKLHKDDKKLTSWNSLLLVAYSKAYKILGDSNYLNKAQKISGFIESRLTKKDGSLFVSYRGGHASGTGHLDDYAFYIWGLLEIFETTGSQEYLEKAVSLNKYLIQNFYDEENGGFFISDKNDEQLIHRPVEIYDGAIPSGNSVETYNLIKLYYLTENMDLYDIILRQINRFGATAEEYPAAYTFFIMSLMLELYPNEKIIAVVKNEPELKNIKDVLYNKFRPDIIPGLIKSENSILPYKIINDETTFYICRAQSCLEPFNDFKMFKETI